jgi:hypothetical protein
MENISVFRLANVRLPMEKNRFLLLFAGMNFFFTGLDVALAHSINDFIPVYELIPVYISPFCALSCLLLSFQVKPKGWLAIIHLAFMALGLMVGVLGTAFHANAVLSPGGHLTWAWVVFGSPILAPLAFCGIALIGLYASTQEVPGQPGVLEVPGLGTFKAPITRERHFIWLVGLGFAGSAITSMIDHAQYGYTPYKLFAIAFGLFATGVVVTIALSEKWSKGDELVYFWTMVGAVLVGVLGFGFHLSADLAGTGQLSLERILAFAPVFAPLLFSDLGILGLLVVAQRA